MSENLWSERTVDDWSVAKLDLDAYLTRIGYTGPRDATEATLTALYRAHLREIRFENFDVFLRGEVAVDLESIQEKIVFRGRGGYCYEQAQLFGAVLERIGFTVDRLLARVGPDGGPAKPRTHLTLRVQAGTGVWLADVGLGSSPPAPLSLRRYRSGGPQEVDEPRLGLITGTRRSIQRLHSPGPPFALSVASNSVSFFRARWIRALTVLIERSWITAISSAVYPSISKRTNVEHKDSLNFESSFSR